MASDNCFVVMRDDSGSVELKLSMSQEEFLQLIEGRYTVVSDVNGDDVAETVVRSEENTEEHQCHEEEEFYQTPLKRSIQRPMSNVSVLYTLDDLNRVKAVAVSGPEQSIFADAVFRCVRYRPFVKPEDVEDFLKEVNLEDVSIKEVSEIPRGDGIRFLDTTPEPVKIYYSLGQSGNIEFSIVHSSDESTQKTIDAILDRIGKSDAVTLADFESIFDEFGLKDKMIDAEGRRISAYRSEQKTTTFIVGDVASKPDSNFTPQHLEKSRPSSFDTPLEEKEQKPVSNQGGENCTPQHSGKKICGRLCYKGTVRQRKCQQPVWREGMCKNHHKKKYPTKRVKPMRKN